MSNQEFDKKIVLAAQILALGLIPLSAISIISTPLPVKACNIFTRKGCGDREKFNEAFMNSFHVYVGNASNVPILVTINYGVRVTGSVSCTRQPCSDDGWRDGTWRLEPGETSLLINDANNSNITFSAKSLDGQKVWSRSEAYMGDRFGKYTYTFR